MLRVPQIDDDIIYIGKSDGEWVGIAGSDRLEHVFVVGATGSGKTSTLLPSFIQDAQQGRAAAFFDIHGRNSPLIIEYISRGREVVYLDATDFEFPFAFNLLHDVPSEIWHLVVDSIMSALRHQWRDSWGERMDYITTNSLMTLLPHRTATLLDLNRVTSDEKWCMQLLNQVKNDHVLDFWLQEFPWGNRAQDVRTRRDWVMPIHDKIGKFAIADPVANIIGQVKNKVDLREIMDEQKLLIVNLDKGKIGERNANLLGSLLVANLNQASLQRENTKPFYCYIDEFTSFGTESFETIVSEARNFGLHLYLAGQYIKQIDDRISKAVRDAILGNCGTLVVFKVAASDVEILAPEFTHPFEETQLRNLVRHEAYVRYRNEAEIKMRSVPLAEWGFRKFNEGKYHREQSRERYATPRAKVEAERHQAHVR